MNEQQRAATLAYARAAVRTAIEAHGSVRATREQKQASQEMEERIEREHWRALWADERPEH